MRNRTALASLALLLAFARAASAGGGPENLLLLVNARSDSSKTIANHYIQLRQIPPSNVLYLDWQGEMDIAPVAAFRTEILRPALEAIHRRKLTGQIDYLVYSSDFPWSIDLRADFEGDLPPKQLAPTASLTGITYLYRLMFVTSKDAIRLKNNHYSASDDSAAGVAKSYGFRARYAWDGGGAPATSGGQHYVLSTMLGVTHGRGTSTEQTIEYLRRSAAADGTRPSGTIYYVQNNNVRSTTRHGGYAAAVEQLRRLGVRAEIVDGKLPRNKEDVQGAMIGTASFDWSESGSTILPGAICEHFTSFGGDLRASAGQTPLTVFLRHGAAGSSGTVVEPYAMADKFPRPGLHVHYARGCTLAEAFYQSVVVPYQLLIVGDPLCRPWAVIPRVMVGGVTAGETIRGTVTLEPQAELASGGRVKHLQVFLDGRRAAAVRPGSPLEIDTTRIADGYHELRVVAIESSPIESQGRTILPIYVDNGQAGMELTRDGSGPVSIDESIALTVNSPGAAAIAVMHNSRVLGRVAGESGRVQIEARQLGRGPVQLQAVALGGQSPQSPPLELVVE